VAGTSGLLRLQHRLALEEDGVLKSLQMRAPGDVESATAKRNARRRLLWPSAGHMNKAIDSRYPATAVLAASGTLRGAAA